VARWALAGLVVTFLAAACSPTVPRPGPTSLVAGRTDAPNAPDLTSDPGPSPIVDPAPTGAPIETPGPDGATAIVPGTVDRASLEVSATYRVNAAITVRTGALDVTTRIVATNNSGAGIDRLELNTIAARLGGIRVTLATVDDLPVRVRVTDQTLLVPLGGVLPAGATTTLTIAYRAKLRSGRTDGDWMFTRSGGTLALYRWIPWVSKTLPFTRPNNGEPFVSPSSPRVDVELLTDAPMVLAAPTTEVDEYVAGSGNAWSFTVNDVRDVSVVLAPDFRMATGKAKGVTVRAFTRPGGLSATQLLRQASDAISTEAGLLGVPFPLTSLTVVETPGGVGLESPGLIWVPDSLDLRNRTYAIYQSTAHQWFYGLVGNDQRTEPFADEAPADLLARTALGTLRPTRCSQAPLDRTIAGYSRTCYYEVVLVQGGRLLDDIRRRMGTKAFWAAMASYVEANRLRLAGTRQLMEALRAASPVDLLPLIRPRFPTLY
jgi:hypothetical protein